MIGFFDSGLGGLSILRALVQHLPHANISYVSDDAHVPYGEKSEEFIRERTLKIGTFLAEQGHSMVVIACNTATAAGSAALRESLPHVQIVGIEPGIKPAAAASQTGRIAVLATSMTAKSERLQRLIAQHAAGVQVDILPCPGWANQVESLRLNEASFLQQAHARLEPSLQAGCDQIVLGCTHYAFLRPTLEQVIAGRAAVIDVAEAVARHCAKLAASLNHKEGTLHLFSTSQPERLQTALPALGLAHFSAKQKQPAQLLKI